MARMQLQFWLGASLMLPVLSHALTVGALKVQSNLGEPFRAEVIVTDLDGIAPADIEASLANELDVAQLGIETLSAADDLIISTEASGSNKVVIRLRTRRPLNEPFLDLVLRVRAGQNVRLQHMTALINPEPSSPKPSVASGGKTILPNLPVEQSASSAPNSPDLNNKTSPKDANKDSASDNSEEVALVPSRRAPPALINPNSSSPDTPPPAVIMSAEERAKAPRYTVKNNDSLWKISKNLEQPLNQPAKVIMSQLRELNQDAFFDGDTNRLKRGASLILPKAKIEKELISTPATATATAKPVAPKPIVPANTPTVTPTVRRGRLPQAEMTVIAPTTSGLAQGNSPNAGRTSGTQPLSRDLAQQVGQARIVTNSLRKEVLELDAQVAANDKKIGLQNSKLAELEQRLKARKAAQRRAAVKSTVPVVAFVLFAALGGNLLGQQPIYAAQALPQGVQIA